MVTRTEGGEGHLHAEGGAEHELAGLVAILESYLRQNDLVVETFVAVFEPNMDGEDAASCFVASLVPALEQLSSTGHKEVLGLVAALGLLYLQRQNDLQEVRLKLEQAIVARDDALRQHTIDMTSDTFEEATLTSAEHHHDVPQRDGERLLGDRTTVERGDVLQLHSATNGLYRIVDDDGSRTIRIACPGADERDIDVLLHPDRVDIHVRGIEADTATAFPARPDFHTEFDGIFSCSACSINDGILTVVLKRVTPRKVKVTRPGREFSMGQVKSVAKWQEEDQSPRTSLASSFRMSYSREPGTSFPGFDDEVSEILVS